MVEIEEVRGVSIRWVKEDLFASLKDEGLGHEPGDIHEMIQNLMSRGLLSDEALAQYEAENLFSRQFGSYSWLTYAPSMKISFGTVRQ
ncbi:hypothetical protein [Paenibacillus aquistagni]|uniref:hypothetical protein n=1 Tax=Paenibacillus aquistagni TaxID=1852522 RepID=UPI00145AB3A2|nr:hypothetical protein [Paenibacillus aquistagni]NMM53967.1 hypothetical protein [Paenibacillus aquistagni]